MMPGFAKLLIPVFFLALGTSCVTTEAAPAERSIPRPDVTWVMLDVGPCFGQCPTYRLKVWHDGRATFEGEDRSCLKGNFSATALAPQVDALFSAVDKIDIQAESRRKRSAVMENVEASRRDLVMERDGQVLKLMLGRGRPTKSPPLADVEAAFEEIKTGSVWRRSGSKSHGGTCQPGA